MKLENTLETLKPYFEEISAKVGEGAGWLWNITIQQQIAEAWLFLAITFIGILLMVFAWKVSYPKHDDYDIGWQVITLMSSILGFVLFTVFFSEAILHFLNPEYQAIQAISNMVTGGY